MDGHLTWLFSVIGFAVATSVTPGPNNLMLMASGANFGFRRTLPHLFGVAFGFMAMLLALGVGLGAAFEAVPELLDVMRWLGIAYLVYLAWRIASASGTLDGRADGRPMTFPEAALFQWLNPKAWAMILALLGAYSLEGMAPAAQLAVMVGVFLVFGMPCNWLWAGFGVAIGRLLNQPAYRRAFNVVMALLLVATMVPVLLM
ncbi:MAG: LysE family translocator [Azospirillaceae bacterium]